jgi:soluble lytic murein transglycosylase
MAAAGGRPATQTNWGRALSKRTIGSIVATIANGLIVALVPIALIAPIASAGAASLSADDARLLKKALKAIDEGKYPSDVKSSDKISNPVARKILTWTALIRPDPSNGFSQIAAFMAENPEWPDQVGLQRRAEEALSERTPDDVALKWFAEHPPISADGRTRQAEAWLATGKHAEGIAALRDVWINGDFAKKRELAFYSRHRRHLTSDDHRQRLDRLMWEGRYWPAHRMLWKVTADYRALAQARMGLRHGEGNVDTLIAKVPAALKDDPGLAYERLRWRRQRGKYDGAIEILRSPPDFLVYPERWWTERAFVTRRLLFNGDVSAAYRLITDHGLKPSHAGAFAEAEWLAGWIALRFLADPRAAAGHFVQIYEAVKYPVSLARGAYWMGRTMDAMKEPQLAETWYKRAAEHPTTYYGQLATARLRPGGSLQLPVEPTPTDEERKAFNSHELVQAVKMLAEIDEHDRLRPFVLRMDDLAKSPAWRVMAAELARDSNRPDLAVTVAKRAKQDGVKLAELAFPSAVPAPVNVKGGLPPLEMPLVLAVVRQESAFNVKAQSHAKAQGLMQLMPNTALKVAKRLDLPYDRRRLTTDSGYNLALGHAYLAELLQEFKGSYVLALAAYNAGPNRARQWIKENGDPRDKEIDSIDWVEMIPFHETRNYVQRVLENLQVYRHSLAKEEIALRLERDLHQ